MNFNEVQLKEEATDSLEFGILVICEDERSNYIYLNEKADSVGRKVKFDFYHGNSQNPFASPSRKIGSQTNLLVEFAIKMIEKLNNDYYNAGQEVDLYFYQEVYVIADVDDNEYHEGRNIGNITRALSILQTAQSANPIIKYELLLSNECFEIWYILHFQDITVPLYRGRGNTAHLANDSNLIRKWLGNSSGISIMERKQKKRTDFFQIMQDNGNETQAIARAKKLETDSKAKNTDERFASNPSTAVYKLIERLNNL